MVDTRAEMRKLGPQKRGTEGRDSCLFTACRLVRGSEMFRLQTEMLFDKGVLSCWGWGSACFVIISLALGRGTAMADFPQAFFCSSRFGPGL